MLCCVCTPCSAHPPSGFLVLRVHLQGSTASQPDAAACQRLLCALHMSCTTSTPFNLQRAHSFRRIKEFEAAIRDYTVAIQGIQKSGAQVNVSLYNHRAYALAKVGCWVGE